MLKRIFTITLVSILLLFLTACSSTQAPAVSAEGTGADGAAKQIVVGYACKDVNDTFQTYLIEAAKEYAAENGIILNISDAQNDVVKQQDQVNNFITQKVDAILVLPIDTSAAAPMTAAAQAANVPLIYVNTNPYPDGSFPDGTYYVGSIEKQAGELQAEYIGKMLNGKGNVCILQGQLVHEGAVQRSEGVISKLAEISPDIKVLASQPADWQKDKAMNVMENWLTAYDNDIQAVFANNDEMAMGAVNALQAIGKTDTYVIGIDGTSAALEAINAGTLAGSVFQDAQGQAWGAMKIAEMTAKGESVPEQILWVPFVLITPDNVDQFVKQTTQ